MTDRNGLFAFEMLSNLDDEVIAAATLPETGSAVAGKPSRKEREPGPFARFMDSGWAAAIISVTVALAVLVGIVAAGRMGTADPSGSNPSHGMIGNQPQGTGEISVTEQGTSTPAEDVRPPVNSIVKDSTFTVTMGNQTFTPLGMVTSWFRVAPDGGTIATDKGIAAIDRLDEVRDELERVVSYSGGAMLITLPEDTIVTEILIYDEAMERVVRDKNTAIAPELPIGEYLVEVDIRHKRADGTGEHVESLFWMTVEDNKLEETLYITAGKDSFAAMGYPINKTYYDSELGSFVTEEMPGASANLEALFDELPLVILLQNERFNLTPLGDTWEFLSLTLYDHACEELYTYTDETYRSEFPKLDLYDYWVVATYRITDGIYETDVEFPFRLAIHENAVDTTDPSIDTAPETSVGVPVYGPPVVESDGKSIEPLGYMLWTEQWYGGGMVSGDGLGAQGQIPEIIPELPTLHTESGWVTVGLGAQHEPPSSVVVLDLNGRQILSGDSTAILRDLVSGTYCVVISMVSTGDYIPEADTYERTCTEFAFLLKITQ